MSKCEHGLTSKECYVCASPKYGDYGQAARAAAPAQRELTAEEREVLDSALWKAVKTVQRAGETIDEVARRNGLTAPAEPKPFQFCDCDKCESDAAAPAEHDPFSDEEQDRIARKESAERRWKNG